MAVILKPRSNKQGIVDTSADLIKIEGRDNYTVLVKDLGVFEWIVSGTVDGANIFAGKVGFWSRVLQSAEGLLAYTAEDQANKSTDIVTDAASDIKYPSVRATKQYADALVTGLLDDRGNFTPGGTSPGAWPTTGGSGTAGAIMKGDIWFCDASGFMGTTAVVAGASFRAIIDTPGQTDGNWNVLSAGAITTTTPNLQQVATVGSTTSVQSVSIVNNLSTSTFTAFSTGGNGGAEIGYSSSSKGFLSVSNGTNTATVRANNLTGDKTYQLPDASGTIALTTDVGLPYKVYTALLTLDGGGILVEELQNTLGDTLTWSNPSNGMFRASATGTPFTAGKTWMTSGGFNNAGSPMIVTSQPRNAFPTKEIEYRFFLHDGTIATTPFVTRFSLEIRVYP
jgi:hypothetical protein